ncbi:MAG: NAD(P)-dependent oxidoreductase [Myxococcota bacterium]
MHVLLTGSSGWLGRHLAPMLEQKGHSVTGLDVAPGRYTQLLGTVADEALIARAFSEHSIDVVVHAGALHKPDIARCSRREFIEVNAVGTQNLLSAAVAAGHDRFVFTSTTSLMIRNDVRAGKGGGATRAFWIDESFAPLVPRNIYGATKLAAENLCRLMHEEHGISVAVLRTGRFFPEEDDTHKQPSGPNLKANEFLNRRLSVADAARAHLKALERAPEIGFDTFVLSAPTPFVADEAKELIDDAPSVISRHFPDAEALYAEHGWVLPRTIDRVYDSRRSQEVLGFEYATDFAAVLGSLREGAPLPFVHDPGYTAPRLATVPSEQR